MKELNMEKKKLLKLAGKEDTKIVEDGIIAREESTGQIHKVVGALVYLDLTKQEIYIKAQQPFKVYLNVPAGSEIDGRLDLPAGDYLVKRQRDWKNVDERVAARKAARDEVCKDASNWVPTSTPLEILQDPNKSSCCQAPFKDISGFSSVYKVCSKCGQ